MQIRAHLAEILASRFFATSPRLRDFLSFVVQTTLAGKGDEIKEFLIATQVYGRSINYDPQIDSTVRVEASRLRGKLREFYASVDQPQVRIELPKGSYVPVFHIKPAEPLPAQIANAAAAESAGAVEQSLHAAVSVRRYLPEYGSAAMLAGALLVFGLAFASDTKPEAAVQDPKLVEEYLRADRLFRQRAVDNGWPGKPPAHVISAIASFQNITRQAPQFAKAWVSLGEAHEWAYELDKDHPQERLQAAVQALHRAIRIKPDSADAHARLASVYFHGLGDVDRAIPAVRRALALNPRDERSQARYADMLRAKGKLHEALDHINRALIVLPHSSRVWAEQGLILFDLGRYDEAIGAATHSLTVNPGKECNMAAFALWVKGISLHQLGRAHEAEAAHREGLQLLPDDERNQASLAYLLAESGRTADALKLLDGLVSEFNNGKAVAQGIAVVLVALGRDDEAADWLKRGRASGDPLPLASIDKRLAAITSPELHARL